MAVLNQTPIVVSTANGATSDFPYNFLILDSSHLEVKLDGVVSVEGVGHSVSGAGNPTGGNVAILTGNPANGVKVVRKRVMPYTREVDYQLNGDFQSDEVNPDQDAPVMMIQQLKSEVDLAIKLPDDLANISGTLPDPESLKALRWNAAANGIENFEISPFTAPGGSANVGFLQSGTGAVARTSQDKMRERVTLKDFGAVGDGITDDTLPVSQALAYMTATGYGVEATPGIYLCDPFSIGTQFYDLQATFGGTDRERCILRRRGTGAGPFITLGDASATVYQSGVNFAGLTIDGGATTNGPALAGYDVVRTSFHACRFKGGSDAVRLYGGISVSFYDCVADFALRGLKISKFTSFAAGGFPNLIKWVGGEIVDNAEWGVHFDHGNMLILRDCDIEGNGTTLGATEGGVYIGPNVGEAVFASDTNSPGLIMSGCWVEANRGRAGVMMESGRNSLESSWWFSQAANITNDVYVTGGRYNITNCKFTFAKAANLLEGASVLSGNLIQNTLGAVLTIDAVKTMLLNGSTPFVQYNGGRAAMVSGLVAPFKQNGSDSTGVNPAIVFSPAFKTGTTPKVQLTPISNSAGTIDAPEAYNITAAGFSIRKKSYNGAAIGTLNYQVDWEATGEALGT